MYYVYILELSNHKFYSGYSSDLKKRLRAHKKGLVATTCDLNPQLVYYCAFKRKKRALDFERYLKSSSGFAFRNKRLV